MQTFLLLYPHTTTYRHYPICKRLGVVHIIENFVLEQRKKKQNRHATIYWPYLKVRQPHIIEAPAT